MKEFYKKYVNWCKYHFIDILYLFLCMLLWNKFAFRWWIVFLTTFPVFLINMWFLIFKKNNKKLIGLFGYYNVLMFGFKRRGKDLTIQQYIISRYRKKWLKEEKMIKKGKLQEHSINYLSNFDYGYGAKIVSLSEFRLFNAETGKEINYHDFLKGVAIKCEKNEEYEGLDLIISEAHLYFPNTESNTLDKYYPSFPVFVALSGHLYNMNIIFNSQELQRAWIKLRNQQDYFCQALKTFPSNKSWLKQFKDYIPFLRKYIFVKCRTYSKMSSAESNMLPFKGPNLIGEFAKGGYLTSGTATKAEYEASNGEINEYWTITKYKDIKYDSRFFHKKIFGYNSNDKKKNE